MKKHISSDPLARFLIRKLGLTPIRALLIIIVVAVIYDLLQVLVFGNITPYQDYLQILTILSWHYVFIPVMGYFYIWSNKALENLLKPLSKGNLITLSNEDVNKYSESVKKPWRFYLSLFGGLALGILFLIRSIFFPIASYTSPLFMIPRQISWFIAGYMVSMLSITLIQNVFVIHSVFKERNIHLRPMHPDESGGFGPLGNYSKTIAYLISSAGFVIGLTELRYFMGLFPKELWVIHLSIPLYIIGATISFFAPLQTAHQRMSQEKTTTLLEIQEQITKEYYSSKENVIAKHEDIENQLSRIKQLQSLYEFTEKAAEWPLNLPALRGYIFSVVSPLISIGFGLLGDYIKGLVFA